MGTVNKTHLAFFKLLLMAYKSIATDGNEVVLIDRLGRVIYIDKSLVKHMKLLQILEVNQVIDIWRLIKKHENTNYGKRGYSNRNTQ